MLFHWQTESHLEDNLLQNRNIDTLRKIDHILDSVLLPILILEFIIGTSGFK